MGRETRAMQDDDATNPGTLWLLDGEALWGRKIGDRSCADCHGEAASSMKGVAARYPAVDAKGRLLNLEQRINECRVERQKAPALAFESRDLLALTALVGRQSRGVPPAPGPAKSLLPAVPRRSFGSQARGQPDPSGTTDRRSDLPARVA